ncbi:DUF1304 family protein [Planktotalea sp.]|uniref:DUF1304 family protein n=1 Tax=Planktotalea sp. TaxID=2029877 RepID=UPI0025D6C135|nr:DUF1304 family protein [Planktotalea sp.]
MKTVALALTGLSVLLHIYIAWFKIFAWTIVGPGFFYMLPADLFEQKTQLAANQGIYNAFLAFGLGWVLFIKDPKW